MKKSTTKNLFFLLFFLALNSVWSQQREYLIGRVLDAKTQEPVVFASIRIKDRAVGIISNIDGSFKIPLKYKEYGDIIEISSMGYQSLEVLIHNLSVYDITTLRLQPAVLELDETVVTAKRKRGKVLSAEQIVKKAVAAISKNFPNNSFSTLGYYRDYQMKGEAYINLNEAILEVFDKGFDQLDFENTKVRIYDYKQNLEFVRDSLSAISYDNHKKVIEHAYLDSYGGNEFTILRVHNAVRNYKIDSYSFVNNLETDLFANHNFKKARDTYTEDEVLYTVKISKDLPNHKLQGRFFISKRDFSIHKMEYAVYDIKKQKAISTLNNPKNDHQLVFKVVTEYKRTNNKMYLNYISFQNSFQMLRPPEFIVNEIIANIQSGCFEVRFNKAIDAATAGKNKNYKFKFLGKKIRFKTVVVFEDAVRLFPAMSDEKADDMFSQLVSAGIAKRKITELLETKVEGILDYNAQGEQYSTLLFDQKKVEYLQFREYFVQQLKPDAQAPLDHLFMNKGIPIFKDQPLVKIDNLDDYWMNTPLQSVKN